MFVFIFFSSSLLSSSFFFFNDTATTEIYTLSLHDALPISAAKKNGKPVPSKKAGKAKGDKKGVKKLQETDMLRNLGRNEQIDGMVDAEIGRAHV